MSHANMHSLFLRIKQKTIQKVPFEPLLTLTVGHGWIIKHTVELPALFKIVSLLKPDLLQHLHSIISHFTDHLCMSV
jgi:hypothetical protein